MKKYLHYLLLLMPLFLFAEYKNSDGNALNKSFKELLEWSRNSEDPIISLIDISSEWQEIDLANDDNYVIWIGHSTFLIKKNGYTILTDPIFSERASPFKRIGPKRLIPPALLLEDIPRIDIVTVSHNHYDHLDINSLQKISTHHPDAVFLVPAGDLKLLSRKKIKNAFEFEWWESFKANNIKFTFTPVQHWSKRGLFDRNKSLWGGWYIQYADYALYHAGDTGYSGDFKDTKNKLGSPKYAFIPIGAYDPEWFMSSSHVNPEEALQIMIDLEAEHAFGMHWGTFVLTDEDTLEPPQRLKKAINDTGNINFQSLQPGKVINLK
jgi:L-ascorbate metabolism protein UlaG (beta-lactamase superfamily)